jgi:AraC family transcriptional regulator of arabinose operon
MDELTVEGIADALGLDRRYLSRLFKEHTGSTIQEYLIHTRMEAADQYLRQGYAVQEAAALSGYRDTPNFSRMYKLHFGIAPKNRKSK